MQHQLLWWATARAFPCVLRRRGVARQNRQSAVDRQDAKHDYEVNLKSELEIELLHDKMNLLLESEIVALTKMLKVQQQQLERIEDLLSQDKSQ